MTARLLVVGEAPPPADVGVPLMGASGRRLAELAGMRYADLFDRVDAVNLFDAWPGPAAGDHGSAFDVVAARERADGLAPVLRGRRVVLLGGRVAQAFRVNTAFLARWRHIERFGAEVAVIPHPSGVCRSYNDSATRDRVSTFLRRALGVRVTDPAPRALPLEAANG